MSFEKLSEVGSSHPRPIIKPDPDAPTLPVMSSSAPVLSPWSTFYMTQGFQSFPFPSPSTSYAMAMGMGISSGDLVMPTPGPWGDYSHYPPLGVSPGPQSYQGGAFSLDTPNPHSMQPQAQQGMNVAPPPDSASSGPPPNATSYFQSIPAAQQKSTDFLPQQVQEQQHARAPEPMLRNVAHANHRAAKMPFSRSPSPSRSISPAMLTKDLGRRSSNQHVPPSMTYPRDSIDSTTSMISVDGGTRSAAASIHSSDGLDEDDAMYGEGEDVLNEHDPEGEGTERNGMMWGMKTGEYKSLSARERKRVRNRISARTFRARRKEHLSSLESTLSNKDHMIRRLQEENTELREQLAKYEKSFSRNGPAKCR